MECNRSPTVLSTSTDCLRCHLKESIQLRAHSSPHVAAWLLFVSTTATWSQKQSVEPDLWTQICAVYKKRVHFFSLGWRRRLMLSPSYIIDSLIALTELKEALGTGRQKTQEAKFSSTEVQFNPWLHLVSIWQQLVGLYLFVLWQSGTAQVSAQFSLEIVPVRQ